MVSYLCVECLEFNSLKAGMDPSMIGQSAPNARPSLGVFERIDEPLSDGSSGNRLSLVHRFGDTKIARRSGHRKQRWPL